MTSWHPPTIHLMYPLQAAAMHSDCIFKKEQALCLKKIQSAYDLLGMNDSSLGEWNGRESTVSPAQSLEALFSFAPTYRQ